MNKTILTLNQKHLVIASLNLSHNYYLTNVIPNIEFHPSPKTLAFLKNYRLILKQEGSRLIILQEGKYEESIWIPKIAIQEIHSLVLGIKFNDDMFQNKTNVPFYTSKDQKFFIPIKSGENSNLEQELKIHPFYGGTFPNISDLKTSVVKIKYETSSEIKNLSVDKINSYEDFTTGIYTFHYENEEESTFIWSDFDKLYDGYVSIEIQQNAQNIFNYKFNSRSIHWQYILVSNNLKDLESCLIVDDKLEMKFYFEENKKNQSQFIFTSINPVALKERYSNKLSLEKMGEKLLNLPFPELKNFNINQIDVKKSVNKYFLTTYVNL